MRPRAAKVYQISIVVLLSLFRVSVVMNGLEHSGVELNDDNPNKTDAFSYPSVLLLLIMGLRLKVAVFHGEDHVSGISSLCAAQGCIVPSCAHTHTHIQTSIGTYSIIRVIIHLIIFSDFSCMNTKKHGKNHPGILGT